MSVPAGSLVFQTFPAASPSEEFPTVVAGHRIGINGSSGALLSECPSSALLVDPNAPVQVLSLDDGRTALIVNSLLTLYSSVGAAVVQVNLAGLTPVAGTNIRVCLGGSDGTSKFYVTITAIYLTSTLRLYAGLLDPVTGVVSDIVLVDNVTITGVGAPELYGVAIDEDGILYYIKSNNADPILATHALKAYDIINDTGPTAVASYNAGVAYPLPASTCGSFAFDDGTLNVVFGAQYGSVTQVAKHISEVDGSVTRTFAPTGVSVTIFAGLADTSFWLNADGVYDLITTSSGTVIATPPLEQGYVLDAVVAPYTLLTGYPSCVAPPPMPEERYIRRVRRFRLPFNQNLSLYLNRWELLIQPGMGASNGQGVEPIIFVRFSGDGGTTWGPTIRVPAGRLGEYGYRPALNQIGKLRDPMCEIWVSDPIYWYLLGCYVDGDFAGT